MSYQNDALLYLAHYFFSVPQPTSVCGLVSRANASTDTKELNLILTIINIILYKNMAVNWAS